jgi:hypothetical protein
MDYNRSHVNSVTQSRSDAQFDNRTKIGSGNATLLAFPDTGAAVRISRQAGFIPTLYKSDLTGALSL